MKKFGTVLLTVYVTVTTIAAALFGYLYFNDKTEENKSVDLNDVRSLVDAICDDLGLNKTSSLSYRSSNNEYVALLASGSYSQKYEEYTQDEIKTNLDYLSALQFAKYFVGEKVEEKKYYSSTASYDSVTQTMTAYFEYTDNGARIYLGGAYDGEELFPMFIEVSGDPNDWSLVFAAAASWKPSGNEVEVYRVIEAKAKDGDLYSYSYEEVEILASSNKSDLKKADVYSTVIYSVDLNENKKFEQTKFVFGTTNSSLLKLSDAEVVNVSKDLVSKVQTYNHGITFEGKQCTTSNFLQKIFNALVA